MTEPEKAMDQHGSVVHENAALMVQPDSLQDEPWLSASAMTALTVGMESLLVIAAFAGAAFFNFYDLAQPSSKWLGENSWVNFFLGCLLALPLFGVVAGVLPRVPLMKQMLRSIEDSIAPLFQSMSFYQMVLIAVSAGIGEEVFFRWFLLGGLSQYLSWWAACGIASLLFGLCHYLNFTYFMLTTLVGVLLAGIYLYLGLLAAVACHATYDVLALVYLKRKMLRQVTRYDERSFSES